MRVLLVEDEPRLAATVARGLRAEGFVVVVADNGVDGLQEATENGYDVVVLDIMLPGLSGYEVLRRMRSHDVWRNRFRFGCWWRACERWSGAARRRGRWC